MNSISKGIKRVGAHVSTSDGIELAPLRAQDLESKAFALWVKNSKRFFQEDIELDKIKAFKDNLIKSEIDNNFILPHASYLINLGSYKEELRDKSVSSLIGEMKRCQKLGLKYLNLHPGSHLNMISEEACLEQVADNINKVHLETEDVTIALETAAGQGTNICSKFEELYSIIKNVKDKKRVGVCIDTCHIFASGYDIRTEESSKKVFEKFFGIIDKKYLKGVHLNDSKKDLGSRRDSHESIGKGFIGLDVFKVIMNDDMFNDIPLILETPDPLLWKEEIKTLYNFIK